MMTTQRNSKFTRLARRTARMFAEINYAQYRLFGIVPTRPNGE
jgi:hypothetical protein